MISQKTFHKEVSEIVIHSLLLLTSSKSNAASEWQARTPERKQEIGGGLSTQGACYPFFYAVTPLWSASWASALRLFP
jgi:hypothetical protein